jgi:arabinogalactan endo-1,4-beta-galactosidase
LSPKIVQIGNEINPMILQKGTLQWPINWTRNSLLLNKGIEAVRNFSNVTQQHIEIMLHIAQPENAIWWFDQASTNNVVDYDWIGLSYYPQWSLYNLSNLGPILTNLRTTYDKKLMIVETAYPFTLQNIDGANNILDSSGLLDNYPANQQGQLNYLTELKRILQNSGGSGLVYWEPAWVSTSRLDYAKVELLLNLLQQIQKFEKHQFLDYLYFYKWHHSPPFHLHKKDLPPNKNYYLLQHLRFYCLRLFCKKIILEKRQLLKVCVLIF